MRTHAAPGATPPPLTHTASSYPHTKTKIRVGSVRQIAKPARVQRTSGAHKSFQIISAQQKLQETKRFLRFRFGREIIKQYRMETNAEIFWNEYC